jgi:hypothetical protein
MTYELIAGVRAPKASILLYKGDEDLLEVLRLHLESGIVTVETEEHHDLDDLDHRLAFLDACSRKAAPQWEIERKSRPARKLPAVSAPKRRSRRMARVP